MYIQEQFKQEEQEGRSISPPKPDKPPPLPPYDNFLLSFKQYRYVYLLFFCIALLFLVIAYAKMIFAIRRNIAQLISLQRSTYSRDISNVQIDLQDDHKETQQIVTQEQVLLAQKWKGIRNQDLDIFSDLANEELQYYQQKYNIIDYQEQPFCLVVYNFNQAQNFFRLQNIKSILMQNYNNYHIIYVDKLLTLGSEANYHNQIQKLLHEHNQKKIYRMREQKRKKRADQDLIIHTDQTVGYVENLYIIAETHCKENEIVMFADSSDYFIGKEVLKLFNGVYEDKKYNFAYTNYLDANNQIGNLSFMGKKKVNATAIVNNPQLQAPLFAIARKTLSTVIEEYLQRRLVYEEEDERLRVNLIVPILEHLKGSAVYIPEVNYAIDFVRAA